MVPKIRINSLDSRQPIKSWPVSLKERRVCVIYAIYKSIKTQLNTLRELCQTQRAAEMKHLRQIIETIMISLMGRVTSARGLVTMSSGGGTRPDVESAPGKYCLYNTFYNVQYSPPPLGSPSSVIFHHILLYNRRHFNGWRHFVPACLARLDPTHSPLPIFHSHCKAERGPDNH